MSSNELTSMSADARHKLGASLLADGFPHTELAAPEDFDAIWKFVPEAGFKFHLFSDNTPESIATIDPLARRSSTVPTR